jgi:hypothetical protein
MGFASLNHPTLVGSAPASGALASFRWNQPADRLVRRHEVVTFGNKSGEAVSWINFCIEQNGRRVEAAKIFAQMLQWWRLFVDTM